MFCSFLCQWEQDQTKELVGYPCFYNVLDPFNKVHGKQSDENK